MGPEPSSATDIFAPPACPDCGRALAGGALRCPDCGWRHASLPREDTTPSAAPPTPEPQGEAEPAGSAAPSESAASAQPRMPPPDGGGTQIFVSAPVLDRGRIEHLLPDGETSAVDFDAELLIGRDEGDLVLPDDPFVSDTHARIRRSGQDFVVEDLDSVNGTFVRLAAEHELRPGDRILLGGQIFEFVV